MLVATHLKSGFYLVVPIFIGLVISVFVLQFSNLDGKKTKFDELALGQETKTYRAAYQGSPVHCNDLTDGDRCLEGWKQRGEYPVTLWLGNSQLHAINQMKPNDVNGVQVLYELLVTSGNELLTFSQPNANLQEHYLLFEYLLYHLPIKTLLLPVVFDDTRNTGIRDGLIPAISELRVQDALSNSEIGQQILDENNSKTGGDLAGLNDTPQKVVESAITSWLTEHWLLWKNRPNMRGQLLINLHLWRNSLFGITAQSKRKIIPGRYAKNLAATEAMLQACAVNNISVILYIAPLRNDVETPYVAKEYSAFKREIEMLAVKFGAVFANLEGLVPGKLWGSKDATSANGEAELDFMHFQASGHHLLAEKMFNLLQYNHFLSDKR